MSHAYLRRRGLYTYIIRRFQLLWSCVDYPRSGPVRVQGIFVRPGPGPPCEDTWDMEIPRVRRKISNITKQREQIPAALPAYLLAHQPTFSKHNLHVT